MAEATPAYLLNEDGKVEAVAPEDAQEYLATGYAPAGKQQIDDFKKEEAFHEKFGTLGQQAKTFGEGASQALTLGLSDYLEKGLGVNPEDIKAREEENPGSHMAGTITGVAAPLILTGGASAAAEGAEGVGLLGGAAKLTAPSLIAKAGELGAEGVTGILGQGSGVASRIAAKAASAGFGSAIEGAAYGLGQVVHESALGDPNLTASHAIEEIGLSALLGGGIGAGTGALGKLIGEGAGSKLGEKLDEWMHRFEGDRNLSAATGGANGQALIKQEAKKIGLEGVNQIGREGGELGLVGPLTTPEETLSRSHELLESSGKKMGDILDQADASGAAPKSFEETMDRIHSDVLGKMEDSPFKEGAAKKIQETLGAYEEALRGSRRRGGARIQGPARAAQGRQRRDFRYAREHGPWSQLLQRGPLRRPAHHLG